MVNYACAFSQSELGKYFEWIISLFNALLFLLFTVIPAAILYFFTKIWLIWGRCMCGAFRKYKININMGSIFNSIYLVFDLVMKHCIFFFSLRKLLTFHDATTGFPLNWRLRNESRNSILMRRHYQDHGSASDWMQEILNQSETLPRCG